MPALRTLALALASLVAAPADAQAPIVYDEHGNAYYDTGYRSEPAVPAVALDLGANLSYVIGGGDSDGTGESTPLVMGAALALHAGIDIEGFVLIGLLQGSASAQVIGAENRLYLGAGPQLLLGYRPWVNNARLGFEIGGGVDYGVSERSSGARTRRAEGFFPTGQLRFTATAAGENEVPMMLGLHLQVVVPPDQPDLAAISGGIMVGLRTH